MRILKKIFGAKATGSTAEPSSPAPVADPTPSDLAQKRFIVRAPRIPLPPLHNIRLTILGEGQKLGPIPITNISTSGLGVAMSTYPPPVPGVSAEISADISFDEKHVFRVSLIVARINNGFVGFRFTGAADDLRQQIFAYFKLELSALSMVKIDPKYHKHEVDGRTHWFHGDACDLYYVETEDACVRFRLTFLGNHIDGGVGAKLNVGQVLTETPGHGSRVKGTATVHDVENPNEILEVALKFLELVQGVPDAHRAGIAAMIRAGLETKRDSSPA